MKVLIFDCCYINQFILTNLLNKLNLYDVTTVTNGKLVEQKIKECNYDLIFYNHDFKNEFNVVKHTLNCPSTVVISIDDNPSKLNLTSPFKLKDLKNILTYIK